MAVRGLVYSYSRFSDPRQASGHSLERQRAYAARWAAEHGLVLDESLTLHDAGLSAYHQHHVKSGALGAFLAAVEAGKVPPGSVLVVEGLDRLSRAEPIQAQAQLAQIVNAGITVVTASDGRAYSRETLKANPMDLVYSLLVMIRAHEESDTKAKRVRASIVRACEGWIAGSYRGLIRNGKDPIWLRLTGEPGDPSGGAHRWEQIPERVAAVRAGLDLYRRGYSATRILAELTERKLSLTGRGPQALQIYRLIHQRALLGEKELAIDGREFRLPGYYPALLTEVEWSELQALAAGRGRRAPAGKVPGIITGMQITKCGYCGRAMVGQNIGTRRRRKDGGINDGHRRLHCISYSYEKCPVAGSTSVAPVERAIMSFCSDLVNLKSLYEGDRAAEPRARIARLRTQQAAIADQLQRLTDALLSADPGAQAPAVFMQRARELEQQQAQTAADIDAAERDIAAVARTNLSGADDAWRALADGVEAQDEDARIQARQLVADTFERIIVYHRGVTPEDTPAGQLDIMLLAKGGTTRLLRIDKTGRVLAGEQAEATAEKDPPAP
jgi:DNA invertase Pin-like site-specific DNA recombinase